MDKKIKKEKVSEAGKRHPELDLLTLAEEAYIYGYPLVYCIDTILSSVKGISKIINGPLNTFQHMDKLADYKDEFVSVNNDTLYSIAMADVSLEPLVLHIPDAGDRYNVFQLIDAWSNNFAYLGTRASNNKEGLYLLTGPDWNDEIPQEVKQIKVPTNTFVIAARFAVKNKNDIQAVQELQKQCWITPLSFFPKIADVSKLKADELNKLPQLDKNVDRQIEFWEALRVFLKYYPPSEEDKKYQSKFKPLGILDYKEGQESPYRNIDEELLHALEEGAKRAKEKIDALSRQGKPVNGWLIDAHAFDYNLDFLEFGTIDSKEWKVSNREQAYMMRALAARVALWGNHGYEATYAQCYVDESGEQLSGKNKYKLHFDVIPPVDAFWSITMYNMPNFYLCKNPIDRYSIGDRTEGLKYNKDGSLDIYIQKDSPGKDKESNWLPAPDGNFRPLMRMYLPKDAILSENYQLPPIQKE